MKEFVDSCRKHGVKPGLYFTTTDSHMQEMYVMKGRMSVQEYEQEQLDQMDELLTNYGDIAYFWFDHHIGNKN